MRKGRLRLAAGMALGTALGTAYVAERALARRWRAGEDELTAAGLSMPSELEHHFVTAGDGGRIHVVEAGAGPPIVLIHGITLAVGVWARQFRDLSRIHRVIAIDLRGHGQSIGGSGGYGFERLADDVIAVFEQLEVHGAIVVGHSMGGMVLQRIAIGRAEALKRHAKGIVLLATDAGPAIPGPIGHPMGVATTRLAWRAARFAERRGKGVYPGSNLATLGSRVSFGAHPRATDVELVRSISVAVSPRAMAELLGPLLDFDVRSALGEIEQPTLVVVGTRDLLTPPRRARLMAAGIPGARLEVLPGCGHLVMLERPEALSALLEEFSRELAV
jgi:pimeloyl-ACP methyl ester carboxylesterase